MVIGKDIADENIYLEKTIEAINILLNKYGISSENQDKAIIAHRKFLWDNRSELDEIEINENCSHVAIEEKLHASKVSRIKTLERQLRTPYFSRIDFKEDGEQTESFYIGISTIEDEENFEFFVFDWRSPVANMFYDFESGPAYYDAPSGRINGSIELNRQFNIKNGKIVFTHDSNTSLHDEALGEMLGGNATDKMKNIVATIQKEQNDIIRNDNSKVLFIQGAAGSGKTSIALHRAAYLLYKHRKTLAANNILIFSPNEVFAEYISDVLPELGENNILQSTFEIYSKKFLPVNYIYENKNEHLDYIYSNNKDKDFSLRAKGMEYKNSIDFMNVLDCFVKELPKIITNIKPIIIDDKEVISKNSVYKTLLLRFEDIPFLNRLDVVKQSLFSQLETKYLNDKDNLTLDYVEDKNQFYQYCREEVNNQVDSMILTLDNVEIYKMLWRKISNYSKDNLNDIKEITLDYLNKKEVKFEDITPIIYIRNAMEGFRNYSNIKHILIDEAQDYSPLFYEMIKKSFNNAKITIMGDLNQRIDNHSNIKNKNNIINVFEDVNIAILRKSYRSTANITNFTKTILKNGEPIEAIERYGVDPTLHIIKEKLSLKINNKINEMKANGYKSIAVICKSKSKTEDLYKKLKEVCNEINIIVNDDSDFNMGVNIITSYLAKGLEFDGVILADTEEYMDVSDENLFYTVCTRALHELYMISNIDIRENFEEKKELVRIILD